VGSVSLPSDFKGVPDNADVKVKQHGYHPSNLYSMLFHTIFNILLNCHVEKMHIITPILKEFREVKKKKKKLRSHN
jgi:hypothetical protein